MPQSPVTQNVFLDGPLPSSSVFVYYVTALYSQCESVPSGSAIIWTEDIKEIGKVSTVYLYPNPTDDFLVIKSEFPLKRVAIYSDLGELIYILNTNDSEIKVNTGGYLKGLYFVRVISEEGSFSEKFVVK
jgi:hypothetical protein